MTRFFTLDAHSFQHVLRCVCVYVKNALICSQTVICGPGMYYIPPAVLRWPKRPVEVKTNELTTKLTKKSQSSFKVKIWWGLEYFQQLIERDPTWVPMAQPSLSSVNKVACAGLGLRSRVQFSCFNCWFFSQISLPACRGSLRAWPVGLFPPGCNGNMAFGAPPPRLCHSILYR